MQNTFVGDGSSGSYGSSLVRIVLWLFDNREYNKFLDNDCLACMEQAHNSYRGEKQRMKLRSVIKILLAKVTSEEPNKKHGSPINLEVGDDGITWAIVREYMSSLKKSATVEKKLAYKYKIGKGSSRRSSAATTATAAPTTALAVATDTPTAASATATPTAASASNRRFAETIANDLVDVLISQSLSPYEGVSSASCIYTNELE